MLKSLGLWKVSTYSTGPKSSPTSEMTDLEMSMKTEDGSLMNSKALEIKDMSASLSELSIAKESFLGEEEEKKKKHHMKLK